ncbi:DUF6132 family protein [Niabella sp. CC-SYL272]|uniref:DUF6132 family protein n=1 Tax=Niabella agricola TaxID=2891571 RepID=UPI001F2D411A|nr:DUF6132 family protein [Niabella agricola]MCF3107630.1 DUF6132 family protein [Niabella agricola]
MKKFVRKQLPALIGVMVGAAAGYFYWKYIGCRSGTCAITSKPLNSAIYGAILGGLLFSTFKRNKGHDISGNDQQ